MLREIVLIILGICLILIVPSFSKAALTLSDQINDVRSSVDTNHSIAWTVSDVGGIAENERITINFENDFDSDSILASDVDLLNDSVDISLASDCSGSEKVSFTNLGSGSIRFLICAGNGGAIATGSEVELRIGTNASGGVNQITNPTTTGGYIVEIVGSLGYSDSDKTQVVIMDGVTTTATVPPQNGDLRITGYASPSAVVNFLEGGSIIGNQVANGSSYFDKTLFGLTEGIHTISIYATDTGARNTLTISFGVNVIAGSTTTVSNILLPPTISIAQNSVKRPATMTASGMARNEKSVQVIISGSGDSISENKTVNSQGNWSMNVNPKLHLGNKTVYGIALDGAGGISESSSQLSYEVLLSADINADNLVDLVDFSILMYNYNQNNPENVLADINDDGSANITDFSVMMYYWSEG